MQMHRSVIKGNFAEGVGSETNRLGCRGNNFPICPKPRRLGSTLPDFLNPQGCNIDSQLNYDGRNGVHNMIADKATEGRETTCSNCSSYCYAGSPPGRSMNPLIHDVQFVHKMELFPPLGRT